MIPTYSHIILHHSLTKDGQTVSWQAIRNYHINTNHWADIGYHFGIERVNDEFEILVGRDLDTQGAHCISMNQVGIGICFVGNFDIEYVPEKMWNRGLHFVKSLQRMFHIPVENVRGHRDYDPKTCPGSLFNLDEFRKDLANIW